MTEAVSSTGPSEGPQPSGPIVRVDPQARMQILFAILMTLFLSALDQTIVGTALPTIVTDLQGNDLYTWVVTVYLLTATITGPVYGKLSDQFGRRNLLMIGVSLFLLGSALSGLSGSMAQLIIFRGIQGLGAGSIFPIAIAVIGDLFTPAERGKYQGLFGAVFGLSAVIGPALGGLITDYVGWHWIFFVNLPIGFFALAIIWRLLPQVRLEGVTRRIDYLGVALFTMALVPILIGLTNKARLEWTDPWVGGLIVLGLAVGVIFLFVESRAAEPIVPLELFRIRSYSSTQLATFLASFGFFSAIVFLPRWFQVVNDSTATESGYQILPLLAGLILSSVLSGALVTRTGRYKLISLVALILMAIGSFLFTSIRFDTPLPVMWVWMFILGAGIGPTLAVFTLIIQNTAPRERLGVATSNLTLFRQVGGTVGLAVGGTLFGSTLLQQAPIQVSQQLTAAGVAPGVVARFGSQFAGSGLNQDDIAGVGDLGASILAAIPEAVRPLVEPLIPDIVRGIHAAFSLAVADTFWLGVIASVLALGAALFIREVPLRGREEVLAQRRATGAGERAPMPIAE